VPPGGGVQVDTGGLPITQAIMPLPYESTHMAPLMALVQDMVQTGQRVGGTSEMQVGEGRADAPVGTTLALIDQAVKIINSVHKRMFTAQAEEIALLVKVFREHPHSFFAHKCKSKTVWDAAKFIEAVNNCELVPQADPNTASMGQRVLKIQGLKQLQAASPNLYDPIAIDTAALQAMGWSNPEAFFVPPTARAAPPPELQELQAKIQNDKAAAAAKTLEAQSRMTEAQAKAADVKAKVDTGHYAPQPEAAGAPAAPPQDTPVDVALAQAKILDSHTRARDVAVKEREAETENRNRDQDRAAKLHETAIALAGDLIKAPTTEGGGQVSTSGVGHRASKIIKDADKGLK